MENNNPLGRLSVPARAVIVGGIVFAVLGTAGYVWVTYDELAPGRYPVIMFALPAVLLAAALVIGGLWILRLVGVPIQREIPPEEAEDSEPPPESPN